jgi:iron complex outermembrane receptor protein
MRAYALANPAGSFDSKLKVWSAHMTGELDLLTLQGGVPEWVIGFERRDESGGGSTNDSRVLAGEVFGYSGEYTQGDYSVNEWFGEVRMPFVFGKRFAEVVTAEVSFRVSDYDILSDKEDVWKYALEWAPTSDVRFRYTYSQGFRAPKIAEYASGEGVGQPPYNDPCVDWGNNPDSVIRYNCAADGLPPDFLPGTIQAPSLIGGNPELEPEASETDTYGIVWTPSFFAGFSATLDYFVIEIDDAIGTLGVNELITSCYKSPNFSSPSCELILGPEAVGVTPSPNAPTRRSASQNVAGADLRLGNLASFEIKGWDLAVNYAVYGILGGSLDLTLVGTYLESYKYDAGPGYPALDLAGSFGTDPYLGRAPAAFPEWKANFTSTYSRNNWGVSYFLRWLDGVDDITGADCGLSCDVDAYFYHDINGYYDWGNTTFSFGVRNLFDKDPPYVTNYADMNTLSLNYDTSGRYFYTGISMRF